MAAPTKDISKKNLKSLAVLWHANSIGWCKDVDFSGLKLKTVDKDIAEIGDLVVDSLIVGVEGDVKVKLEQVDIDMYRFLIPWASGTGAIAMNPAMYTSLYSYAQILNFHPNGNGDASEDFNFVKAVPVMALPGPSDGKKFRELDVTFRIFQDQTLLLASPPVPMVGYIGPIPA